MLNNDTSEGVTGGIDMNFIMKALTSEVKRMFRAELEQFHERVEQSFEHPRNPPIRRRRERQPRRGVQIEEEGYEGDGFEDEIDHDSVVSDKRTIDRTKTHIQIYNTINKDYCLIPGNGAIKLVDRTKTHIKI